MQKITTGLKLSTSSPFQIFIIFYIILIIRSGSAQLFTANELALAKGFKPKPAFTRSLGSGYNVKEYDFANNKVESVRQVRHGDTDHCVILIISSSSDQRQHSAEHREPHQRPSAGGRCGWTDAAHSSQCNLFQRCFSSVLPTLPHSNAPLL